MTPEQRQRLDDLVGGRADGLIEHAQAFVSFLKELEKMDQQIAITDMITRFKRPEYKNDAKIEGEKMPLEQLEKLGGNVGMMVEATLNYIISRRMEPDQAADEIARLLSSRANID